MKTQTSKTRIWLSTLLVLPIIATLFYSFAEHVEVEKETNKTDILLNPTEPSQSTNSYSQEKPIMVILINRFGELLINDELGTIESIKTQLKTLKKSFDNSRAVLVKYDPSDASDKAFKEVNTLVRSYDFKVIHVDASQDIVPPPPPIHKKTKGNDDPKQKDYETVKTQGKAIVKQVAEYNSWAKKLNNQDMGDRIIKKKDHDKYKRIYGLMSAEQKKNAESFPQIPPPPPAPKVKKGEASNIPPPPPPAPALNPESTLDFVIRMAKVNAKFINEGKSISSDEAIELIKKNPKLKVSAEKTDTKQPLVYFFKKPRVKNVKE